MSVPYSWVGTSAMQRHKLNRLIKSEARWAVEGISARRKRNQGRVRALQALRTERAGQIRRQGTADLALSSGSKSGKKVIEAEAIGKSFGDTPIVQDFSITIQRGDRVAFVGPNGVGKTTLLKLLLGQIAPDEGTVRLGTNLEVAVFDQARAQLDPDATLWDSLTGDADMEEIAEHQAMKTRKPRFPARPEIDHLRALNQTAGLKIQPFLAVFHRQFNAITD